MSRTLDTLAVMILPSTAIASPCPGPHDGGKAGIRLTHDKDTTAAANLAVGACLWADQPRMADAPKEDGRLPLNRLARESPRSEVTTMDCNSHPGKSAVGVCVSCGKGLCDVCTNKVGGKMYCETCSNKLSAVPSAPDAVGRVKLAAGLFGILIGGLGVHKFYLGEAGLGILYLLFCWTGIPSLIGLVEGIIYLTMSDADFNAKYNAPKPPQGTAPAA